MKLFKRKKAKGYHPERIPEKKMLLREDISRQIMEEIDRIFSDDPIDVKELMTEYDFTPEEPVEEMEEEEDP